jgi:hypothetical protein
MSEPTADYIGYLGSRVAELARRIADLLQRHGGEESGAAAAAGFLREWADSAPSGGDPGRLDRLTAALGITPAEVDLVLLAGLPDEHEGLAATIRQLHPLGDGHPGLGLAALLGAEAGLSRQDLRRLVHEGAAVRSGLLGVTGTGAFFERSLVLADGIWQALHGIDAWPTQLPRPVLGPGPAGLDGWVQQPAVQRAANALQAGQDRVLTLTVADESVALSRCSRLLAAAGRTGVAARLDAADSWAIGLLGLHATVRGAVPVLVVGPLAEGRAAAVLRPDGVAGPLLVCAAPGSMLPFPDRPVLGVPVGPVGLEDRLTAWSAAVPGPAQQVLELAGRHPLDPAVTAQVARDLAGIDPDASHDLSAEVSAAIRTRAGSALPPGVALLSPVADWSSLVLRPDAREQLEDAVARLHNQAVVLDRWGMRERARADRGVRLLFAGPPGTGKSLAAEVLAFAAATDLLVVDVSRVVSKWIGETEKNLAAVFDVAERTQAVLLLDEADALFASRTDVGDAHDRYANLQTAWLLQRLDRFDGMAVLASNLRRNIDAAFLRRMDHVIEFELPDEAARIEIWRRHLPEQHLAPDVDTVRLARLYPVPGAWIRNAAIGGAFLAAAESGPITQDHLVRSIRREYGKASKPYPGDPQPRGERVPPSPPVATRAGHFQESR